jgi:PAS domain S-box-containing protein
MKPSLNVLLVEDCADDAVLITRELADGGYEVNVERVETAEAMRAALARQPWDVVLTDYTMPRFSAPAALDVLRRSGHDLPFIVVSGSIGEDVAVEMMRAGAHDYLLKQSLARLVPAVRRELRDAAVRRKNREAQAALRHAQERTASVLAGMTDLYFVFDRQWRYVDVNDAGKRAIRPATKVPPDRILGEVLWDVFPALIGTDLESQYRRAMTEAVTVNFEFRYPGRDTWWHNRCFPTTDGLAVFATEITDRKLAERQLREQAELLSQAREAVMLIGLDDRISYWNQGAELTYGWTRAEVLGKTATELFGPATAVELERMRRITATKGECEGEVKLQDKTGRALIIAARVTLIRSEAGEPVGCLAIGTDITEKKKLAEQYLRAQRLESLGMLAAGIAHDLNNILAPITMLPPMLRRETSTAAELRMLATLEQCAQRGAGLVRQILSFVHGVAGDARLVQVKHILRDIVAIITETFPKAITLEADVPNDLWPIMANPTQIHQVLLNLCVNARDAMPLGGRLRLRAQNYALDAQAAQEIENTKPGAYLLLEIQDSGTGIAPEILAHIWEPFFTTKGPEKGTGLGLATVRGIVGTHDGAITLQTEVGRGTTFRIYLPAAESATAVGPAATLRTRHEGGGKMILLVDDEESIRQSIGAILKTEGYRVITAVDGATGAEAFKLHAPEIALVITDLDMPRADGEWLANTIHAFKPNVPVIAMSGLSSRSSRANPRTFASGFLLKPFTPDQLNEAIIMALVEKSGG